MKLDKATVDSLYLFSHSPDHRIYTISEFTSFLVVPLLHEKARPPEVLENSFGASSS